MHFQLYWQKWFLQLIRIKYLSGFNYELIRHEICIVLISFQNVRWSTTFQKTKKKFFIFRDETIQPPRSFGPSGLESPQPLWSGYTEDSDLGMCVAIDPDGGYRWNTRYCSGPDKASFLCQIPGFLLNKISDYFDGYFRLNGQSWFPRSS